MTDEEPKRKVSFNEGEEWQVNKNIDLFFETSAKTGTKVKEVFEATARKIYNKQRLNVTVDENANRLSYQNDSDEFYSLNNDKNEKKKCAC